MTLTPRLAMVEGSQRKTDLGQFLSYVVRWLYDPSKPVGIGSWWKLHGVVEQERANAGIVVTTSYFTDQRREDFETLCSIGSL